MRRAILLGGSTTPPTPPVPPAPTGEVLLNVDFTTLQPKDEITNRELQIQSGFYSESYNCWCRPAQSGSMVEGACLLNCSDSPLQIYALTQQTKHLFVALEFMIPDLSDINGVYVSPYNAYSYTLNIPTLLRPYITNSNTAVYRYTVEGTVGTSADTTPIVSKIYKNGTLLHTEAYTSSGFLYNFINELVQDNTRLIFLGAPFSSQKQKPYYIKSFKVIAL